MSKRSLHKNLLANRITLIERKEVATVTSKYRLTDRDLKDLAELNNRIPGKKANSFKRDPFVWMPRHFDKNNNPLKGSRFYNPLTKQIHAD